MACNGAHLTFKTCSINGLLGDAQGGLINQGLVRRDASRLSNRRCDESCTNVII